MIQYDHNRYVRGKLLGIYVQSCLMAGCLAGIYTLMLLRGCG